MNLSDVKPNEAESETKVKTEQQEKQPAEGTAIAPANDSGNPTPPAGGKKVKAKHGVLTAGKARDGQ